MYFFHDLLNVGLATKIIFLSCEARYVQLWINGELCNFDGGHFENLPYWQFRPCKQADSDPGGVCARKPPWAHGLHGLHELYHPKPPYQSAVPYCRLRYHTLSIEDVMGKYINRSNTIQDINQCLKQKQPLLDIRLQHYNIMPDQAARGWNSCTR